MKRFDIVTGVLQGDTQAPFLFILCRGYLLRMSKDILKENDFTLKKRPEADDIAQNLLET